MSMFVPAATPDSPVMAFLKDAKTQTVIRGVLAPSGFLGLKLIAWGFPQADLGPFTEWAIQLLPVFAVLAWSLAVKTHKMLIAEVARILAARTVGGEPSGTIIIKPGATDGAAKAVADPALSNVVAAGTPEAIKAAAPPPG